MFSTNRKLATTALSGVALVAIVGQALAFGYEFKAPYRCDVPQAGQLEGTVTGFLTITPAAISAGTPVRIILALKAPIDTPVEIGNWKGSIDMDLTGPEPTTLRLTAAGTRYRAGEIIGVQLEGTWTPGKAGTYELYAGKATVEADAAGVGRVSVTCTPDSPRPVAETLTVK
ncbi:hypothetical protein [Nonomuraea lactucae]|uniref:hypothetical protein n=1 Tax=Nonomuraea lactucae TaxID=2249762 RepID=UPI000DE373B6|nr:hypothetical protein [Nonomuraea lactucae]